MLTPETLLATIRFTLTRDTLYALILSDPFVAFRATYHRLILPHQGHCDSRTSVYTVDWWVYQSVFEPERIRFVGPKLVFHYLHNSVIGYTWEFPLDISRVE